MSRMEHVEWKRRWDCKNVCSWRAIMPAITRCPKWGLARVCLPTSVALPLRSQLSSIVLTVPAVVSSDLAGGQARAVLRDLTVIAPAARSVLGKHRVISIDTAAWDTQKVGPRALRKTQIRTFLHRLSRASNRPADRLYRVQSEVPGSVKCTETFYPIKRPNRQNVYLLPVIQGKPVPSQATVGNGGGRSCGWCGAPCAPVGPDANARRARQSESLCCRTCRGTVSPPGAARKNSTWLADVGCRLALLRSSV